MQFDPTRVGPVAIGVIVVLLVMSVASIGLIVERSSYQLLRHLARS